MVAGPLPSPSGSNFENSTFEHIEHKLPWSLKLIAINRISIFAVARRLGGGANFRPPCIKSVIIRLEMTIQFSFQVVLKHFLRPNVTLLDNG